MTTEIDWDNAPEDAEYWFGLVESFYKTNQDGELALYWSRGEWIPSGWTNDDLSGVMFTPREASSENTKYEYGVEYPTNGQKPNLPDDVLVEVQSNFFNFGELTEFPVHKVKWENIKAFRIVDERYKPAETPQDALKPQNPYQRTIIGLDGSKCVVDVYRVLDAFEVDSHAIAHSIKKLLSPGKRHAKTREQDLKEAIKSIEAELLLMEQRNGM